MDPAELERWLDRELKQLPGPRAPGTLLLRVLAAAEQQTRRPWYARGWPAWPLAWRAASLAILTLALAGLLVMSVAVEGWLVAALSSVVSHGAVEHLLTVSSHVAAAATAMRVVWQVLVEPVVVMLVLLSGLLYVMCLVFGFALGSLASGRIQLS
jgi:hypothetical protein